MRNINLIGYACDFGAPKNGARDGALFMQRMQIPSVLNNGDITTKWLDLFISSVKSDCEDKLPIIQDYCEGLYDQVAASLQSKNFPVVIGGDHSMAVGTWSGVACTLQAEESLGLIWFDAHMDAHTPDTSPSGAYHGMPLACLLGHGVNELTSVGSSKTKINPKHVCLVGVRSYEDGEAKLLQELGVRVFLMDEILERGLDDVVQEAISIVNKGTSGYGISVDLDAIDPRDAPGTGSLEPNGLRATDMLRALALFNGDARLRAIEIAEYNPYMDDDKRITADLVYSMLEVVLA